MSKIVFWKNLIEKQSEGGIAIETGRIRFFGQVDGYSTKWLVESGRFSRVFSIDCDIKTEYVCDLNINSEYLHILTCLNQDTIIGLRKLSLVIPHRTVSFVVLDSANESRLTWLEYLVVEPLIRSGATIIIDDVVGEGKHKGEELIPYLRGAGQEIKIIEDFAVIERYKIADD